MAAGTDHLDFIIPRSGRWLVFSGIVGWVVYTDSLTLKYTLQHFPASPLRADIHLRFHVLNR